MPGKIIHTNEILVLLGDQYYAERSAKQAVEILGRRREGKYTLCTPIPSSNTVCLVVNENLRLVEAQLNSFKQKTGSLMKSSSALANLSEPQINEEGLPIMDIREELPDNYDEMKKQQKEQQQRQQQIQSSPPSNALPESVLRARAMMKEADEKISQQSKDTENKALFDLLRELEEEEEEEEEGGGQQVQESIATPAVQQQEKDTIRHNNDDDDESDDMDSFSDDSEDDDRYDTEISENMFDRFGDDEQYPLDGIVDQEDFTAYNEMVVPEIIPASSIREISDEEEYEKSTPKVITKRKTKVEEKPILLEPEEKVKETNPFEEEEAEEPTKKVSKFKLAQQQKKAVETKIKENVTPVSAANDNNNDDDSNDGVPKVGAAAPKKFSKFKLLRQQQKPRNVVPQQQQQEQEAPEPQPIAEVKKPEPKPVKKVVEEVVHVVPEEIDFEVQPPKPKPTYAVADNGIPKVVPNKPKKMSRFKLTRQKTADAAATPTTTKSEGLVAPVQPERIKPKRTVTWDSDISVRDHDKTSAPSEVSETTSYSQPMKNESSSSSNKKIAGSLFKQMRQAACAAGYEQFDDDYPSLDDEGNGVKVDLNELVQDARKSSEAFWRPNDGSEALIPMVKSNNNNDDEDDEEEEEEEPTGIIVAKKNKLDNKIMKGAVMERDIVPVDLEQVEDDMDLREVRE